MDPLSPEAAQSALSRSLMLFTAFEALFEKTSRLLREYEEAVFAFKAVSCRLIEAMDKTSGEIPAAVLDEYTAAGMKCQEAYAAYRAAQEEVDKTCTRERLLEPFAQWASAIGAVSDFGGSPEEKKLKHLVQELVSSFKSGDIKSAQALQSNILQIATQMRIDLE